MRESSKTINPTTPLFKSWGGRWGSNPRQPESQSGALPTELRPPLEEPESINIAWVGQALEWVVHKFTSTPPKCLRMIRPVNRIKLLPEQVANQIAAGEVVERPASVVKELGENALDAGASRVTVEVKAGGRSLIRVTDDGHGMSRDDALMSLERHATSKITRAEDLASIGTMGFLIRVFVLSMLVGENLWVIITRAGAALLEHFYDNPDDPEGLVLLARFFIDGGKAPFAYPIVKQAVLQKRTWRTLMMLGATEAVLQTPQKAVKTLKTALKMMPVTEPPNHKAMIYRLIANAYVQGFNFAEAEKWANELYPKENGLGAETPTTPEQKET